MRASRRRKPALSPAAASAAIPGRKEAWMAAERKEGARGDPRPVEKPAGARFFCGARQQVRRYGCCVDDELAGQRADGQPADGPGELRPGVRGARPAGRAEPAGGDSDGEQGGEPEEEAVPTGGGNSEQGERGGAADAQQAVDAQLRAVPGKGTTAGEGAAGEVLGCQADQTQQQGQDEDLLAAEQVVGQRAAGKEQGHTGDHDGSGGQPAGLQEDRTGTLPVRGTLGDGAADLLLQGLEERRAQGVDENPQRAQRR